mmetsp:Transcript_17368/g.47327  ORF Transcript_17368/g.47327 Transcript_17368/m.47327 type:complete len:205 (+) Transcript_17368:64-678(+)
MAPCGREERSFLIVSEVPKSSADAAKASANVPSSCGRRGRPLQVGLPMLFLEHAGRRVEAVQDGFSQEGLLRRWPSRPGAKSPWHDDGVQIRLEKKWHRKTLLWRDVHHPVHCGLEAVPSPARQHVPDVNDKRVFDRNCVDPVHVPGIQDLQAADAVLLQNREEPIIRVRTHTDLTVEILDGPIMQQAMRGHGVCEVILEEISG